MPVKIVIPFYFTWVNKENKHLPNQKKNNAYFIVECNLEIRTQINKDDNIQTLDRRKHSYGKWNGDYSDTNKLNKIVFLLLPIKNGVIQYK